MPRAQPAPPDFDIRTLDDQYGDWWDYLPGDDGWPCEPKAADWGVWRGRIVAVDYADPAI